VTGGEPTTGRDEERCAANTDRELYREDTGDPAGSYYENSVHVTASGAIGMNVGGTVIVQPIADWHAQASAAHRASLGAPPAEADNAGEECEANRRLMVATVTKVLAPLLAAQEAAERVREIADELTSGIAGTPGPGVIGHRIRRAVDPS
jgi:hypothetical protein